MPAFSPSVRQMISHFSCRRPGDLRHQCLGALDPVVLRGQQRTTGHLRRARWIGRRLADLHVVEEDGPSPLDAQDQHDAQHLAATVGELLPALDPVAHLSPMGHEFVVVALSAPHQVDQHAAVRIVDPFTPIAGHDLVGLAGRHRHVLIEISKAVVSRRADASGIAAAVGARIDALENPAARQHRARRPSSRRAHPPAPATSKLGSFTRLTVSAGGVPVSHKATNAICMEAYMVRIPIPARRARRCPACRR